MFTYFPENYWWSLTPEDFALLGDHDQDTIGDTARSFTLEGGVAERIRCPILILHGANDLHDWLGRLFAQSSRDASIDTSVG